MQQLRIYYGSREQRVEKLKPGTKAVLGSSDKADIKVNAEGVSALHCVFYHDKGVIHVKDLNSTNGTWVNGNRISRAVSLKSGDIIQTGYITILYLDFVEESTR